MNPFRHIRRIGQVVSGLTQASAVIVLALPAVPIAVYTAGRIMDSLSNDARHKLLHELLTVVREFQSTLNFKERLCNDCSRHGYGYMLRHEIWDAALTEEEQRSTERLLLCPACVSKRLGRMLTTTDFDPKFPINWPIFCVFQFASGDSKVDFSLLEQMFDQAEENNVTEQIRGRPINPDTQAEEAQATGEEGSP